MTIGTIVITVLGLAYIVWSYFAVKDFESEEFDVHVETKLWLILTIVGTSCLVVYIIFYSLVNWDKVVF